jgi:hypothetical protein
MREKSDKGIDNLMRKVFKINKGNSVKVVLLLDRIRKYQ